MSVSLAACHRESRHQEELWPNQAQAKQLMFVIGFRTPPSFGWPIDVWLYHSDSSWWLLEMQTWYGLLCISFPSEHGRCYWWFVALSVQRAILFSVCSEVVQLCSICCVGEAAGARPANGIASDFPSLIRIIPWKSPNGYFLSSLTHYYLFNVVVPFIIHSSANCIFGRCPDTETLPTSSPQFHKISSQQCLQESQN